MSNYLANAAVRNESFLDKVRRPFHKHKFSVQWNDDDGCKCGAQRNYITGAVFFYRR